MTIFIFGSTGMLGNYITKYLKEKNKEIVELTRKDIDASKVSFDILNNLFNEKNISNKDIVINCIGIIPQSHKINDTSIKNYFIINSLFPIMLSVLCQQNKAKLIHITTDCVYNGKQNGNYTELDKSNEVSAYGVSKSLGENCLNATIIRTSIIGEENRNKYSLVEWIKSNKNNKVKGYTNHYWNGVTCLQLSKIINEIIDKNLFWNGIRHIFSPSHVSKYDIVKMVNEIYKLNIDIEMFETHQPINKTLSSIYNNLFTIPDLKQQIIELYIYNR